MSDTSNSLLSPTYSLVARGNNWQPWALSDGSSIIISSLPSTMNKTPQNVSEHQIPYYHSLADWFLGATIGNHGHSVIDLQRS